MKSCRRFPFNTIEPDGHARLYQHGRSGLNLATYRAYNPIAGRWISRDAIGESGGLNLYAYVANNPISGRDPSGLFDQEAFRQQVQNYADAGAVAGMVVGADVGGSGGFVAGALAGAGIGAIPGAAVGTAGGAMAGTGIGYLGGMATGAGLYAANELMLQMAKGKFQAPADEPPPGPGCPRKRNDNIKQKTPIWAEGLAPYSGETAQQYASRLLDWKYGAGGWAEGAGEEYNQLVKNASRAYH